MKNRVTFLPFFLNTFKRNLTNGLASCKNINMKDVCLKPTTFRINIILFKSIRLKSIDFHIDIF